MNKPLITFIFIIGLVAVGYVMTEVMPGATNEEIAVSSLTALQNIDMAYDVDETIYNKLERTIQRAYIDENRDDLKNISRLLTKLTYCDTAVFELILIKEGYMTFWGEEK